MQILNLSQLNEDLNSFRYFLLDSKISEIYGDRLNCLKDKIVLTLDEPESYKNMNGFEEVISFYLKHKIRRTDTLVVIGGGALSDLGGFVASSLLRGIKWAVAPTTLLSLIDASIGGKTGINTSHGKNLVGSFHQPSLWFPCTDFLKSLPIEEKNSGLGELVKYHFLIQDISTSTLNESIIKSIEHKMTLVEKDPLDNDVRESLNFGHTFGHAIEKLTSLPHGTCVLHGIFLNLSLFTPQYLGKFFTLLTHYELELCDLSIDLSKAIEVMKFDKKNKKNHINFIVVDERGKVKKIELSPDDLKKRILSNDNCKNIFK